MRSFLVSCAIAATVISPVAAADVTRNDIPKFDIFGIRLYDASDDIITKIRQIKPQDLNLSAYDNPKTTILMTKCVPARAGTNSTYAKRCPGAISFTTSKFTFTAELVEDLPNNPGRMRAYSVTLQSRSLGASFIDLTPIVLKKYGTATLQKDKNLGYCAHPQGPAVESCKKDEPSLTLTDGQTLVLHDLGYQAAKIQAAVSHLPDVKDSTVHL